MKILVLDNYDSFTYNLVHIVRELGYGAKMDIFRNDQISLEAVDAYDKVILSPGPGIPEEAGIMSQLIPIYAPSKSIFGVCLGHQAIGEAFGSALKNLDEVLHGIPLKTVQTEQKDTILFDGIPNEFMAGRYHSWVIDPKQVSADLVVTASDESGEVMAIKHKEYDVRGVQYHPESVLTDHGIKMMQNWLEK